MLLNCCFYASLLLFIVSKACDYDQKLKLGTNGTVQMCDQSSGCTEKKVCVYEERRKRFVCCVNSPKLIRSAKRVKRKDIQTYRMLVDQRSFLPTTCQTWIDGITYSNCPPGYVCVLIPSLGASYCCYQPQPQSLCPNNYERPYFPRGQSLPTLCYPAVIYSCPYSYTCQYSDYYQRNVCCGMNLYG